MLKSQKIALVLGSVLFILFFTASAIKLLNTPLLAIDNTLFWGVNVVMRIIVSIYCANIARELHRPGIWGLVALFLPSITLIVIAFKKDKRIKIKP